MRPAPRGEPMTLYPHGPISFVDDGIFVVEGRWKRSAFERKMTVFRLSSGDVAVHSAIAMDEAGMAALEAIGQPSWILVPNSLHCSDASWYGERYPSARVLVPAAKRAKLFEKVRRIDGSLDDDWPEALRGELAIVPLHGNADRRDRDRAPALAHAGADRRGLQLPGARTFPGSSRADHARESRLRPASALRASSRRS